MWESRTKTISHTSITNDYHSWVTLTVTLDFEQTQYDMIWLIWASTNYSNVNQRVTSSTTQGSGGSFKNRKPIGEVGCRESRMAERSHWWTETCLRSPLFLSFSLCFSIFLWLSTYLPTYWSICLPIYLSVCLSISLSTYLLSYLSSCLVF